MKKNHFFIKSILLTFTLLLTTGCNEEELEAEKKSHAILQSNFEQLNNQYIQLQERYNNIENKLNLLQENNKGLEIHLAKSEVEFTKKHELELKQDKENLKAERKSIEKRISNNIKNQFTIYIIALTIISLLISIFWYINRKKYLKENNELINKKQDLSNQYKTLKEEKEKLSRTIYELAKQIKELEEKQKDTTKNIVVNKIEEYKHKRNSLLESINYEE